MSTIKEAVKHLQTYDEDKPCCLVLWLPEDIELRAEELEHGTIDDEQVHGILDAMEDNHDACGGICWDTIDYYIEELQ